MDVHRMPPTPQTPHPIHHVQPAAVALRDTGGSTPQGVPRAFVASSPIALPQQSFTRCVASEEAITRSLSGVCEALAVVFEMAPDDARALHANYPGEFIVPLRQAHYFESLAAQATRHIGQAALQAVSSLDNPQLRSLLFVTLPSLAGWRVGSLLRTDWPTPTAPSERVRDLETVAPLLMWGPLMLVADAEPDAALLHTVAAALSDDDVAILRQFAATPAGRAYLAGLPAVVAWSQGFVRQLEGAGPLQGGPHHLGEAQ